MDRHVGELIENGEELVELDNGSVLVTGDELDNVYRAACE